MSAAGPNVSAILDHLHDDKPVSTGHADLDKLAGGGPRPGDLVVVAGYPGMGSGMFVLGLASTAAIRFGLGAYVASLESTTEQVGRRILSAQGRISLHHLTSGTLVEADASRIVKARERINSAPLRITDKCRDLETIRRQALDFDAEARLKMLVVDGAHLLVPAHDYGGRAQFADDFARDLKEFAVEHRVVVVVTCPLEFPFGTRLDPRPQVRDFGKRQSFAAAADIIVLIHRDDFYDYECARAGEADLIVLKQRNGFLATATVAFQGHYARFVDLAEN